MDTDSLVTEQIDEGAELLKQLPQHGFDVTAAFWLKATDDEQWYFYLVSPAVQSEGLAQAYRRLHAAIRRIGSDWIDPLGVKMIDPSNPVAQDVAAIHARNAGPKVCPTRWGGKKLGHVSIDGALLYPLPVSSVA